MQCADELSVLEEGVGSFEFQCWLCLPAAVWIWDHHLEHRLLCFSVTECFAYHDTSPFPKTQHNALFSWYSVSQKWNKKIKFVCCLLGLIIYTIKHFNERIIRCETLCGYEECLLTSIRRRGYKKRHCLLLSGFYVLWDSLDGLGKEGLGKKKYYFLSIWCHDDFNEY